MAYKAPEQRPDETPAQWAMRVLGDKSHHVKVTDENRHVWLMSDAYRNKPWTLLTPRGVFKSDRLHDRWVVPRKVDILEGTPDLFWGRLDDVFHLDKIIWHSNEDGWVAEYTERRP